tara:strand:+ start:352 stop:525 length:174 start_codon:yes stop_codon:yes gene_type:complete
MELPMQVEAVVLAGMAAMELEVLEAAAVRIALVIVLAVLLGAPEPLIKVVEVEVQTL